MELKSNQSRIVREGFSNILNRSPDLMLETNSIKVLNESVVKQQFKSLSENKRSNKKRHTGGKESDTRTQKNLLMVMRFL